MVACFAVRATLEFGLKTYPFAHFAIPKATEGMVPGHPHSAYQAPSPSGWVRLFALGPFAEFFLDPRLAGSVGE